MASRLSDLMAWEQELLAEQLDLSRRLEPLLRRKEEIRTKLELVQRLRGLEADSEAEQGDDTEPDRAIAAGARPAATSGSGSELQSAVKGILEARGAPLHLKDIRAELASRGVPIPGRGTDANIIVHLKRASDVFIRTGRGSYGLVSWQTAKGRVRN